MCGIFGIIAKKGSGYNPDLLRNTLKKLALLSESRGKDSSGLAFRNEINKSIDVFKGPISISELLKTDEINKKFDSILSLKRNGNSGKLDSTFAVIGHARLVTNGTQLDDVNNQPVVKA